MLKTNSKSVYFGKVINRHNLWSWISCARMCSFIHIYWCCRAIVRQCQAPVAPGALGAQSFRTKPPDAMPYVRKQQSADTCPGHNPEGDFCAAHIWLPFCYLGNASVSMGSLGCRHALHETPVENSHGAHLHAAMLRLCRLSRVESWQWNACIVGIPMPGFPMTWVCKWGSSHGGSSTCGLLPGSWCRSLIHAPQECPEERVPNYLSVCMPKEFPCRRIRKQTSSHFKTLQTLVAAMD